MTRVGIVAGAAMRARLEAVIGRVGTLVVVASAGSNEAFAGDPRAASVDVLVVHATTPDVARGINALPPIPIVALLRGPPSPDAIPALVAAGVRGILPDDATADEIAAACEAAAAGLVTLPPEQVSDLVAPRAAAAPVRGLSQPSLNRSTSPKLTSREHEILGMLAEGMANKLIASRLGISDHTVKTHLEAIFEKLGASNRAEAVARAVRTGLLLL